MMSLMTPFLHSNASDDESDIIEMKKIKRQFLFSLLVIRGRNYCPTEKWMAPRLIWPDYVAQLVHQNEFGVTFRMSLYSFNKLVNLLQLRLSVDEHQSFRCNHGEISGRVLPELVVGMSLRWLGGGQWPDIKRVFGVSRSYFFFLRRKFINAVMACPELEIQLPDCTDIESLERLSLQFEAGASRPVFRGCVGAVDGLTVFINAPKASETENVLAYYSGHYKHDSLNVQAMADHRGSFLYFAVAAPGGYPDANALSLTRLQPWIDGLPHGFYVLADNAYTVSEHTLIPFSGSQRDVPQHSCYNYFLSQLRIKIEQAFGQFSVKWRILRKPLETALATSSAILTTCARLHNFIIANDWQKCDEEQMITRADVVGDLNEIYRPSLSRFQTQQAGSFLRDAIVTYIEENAYRRPNYNRRRNEGILNFEQYENSNWM